MRYGLFDVFYFFGYVDYVFEVNEGVEGDYCCGEDVDLE